MSGAVDGRRHTEEPTDVCHTCLARDQSLASWLWRRLVEAYERMQYPGHVLPMCGDAIVSRYLNGGRTTFDNLFSYGHDRIGIPPLEILGIHLPESAGDSLDYAKHMHIQRSSYEYPS